MRRAATLLLLVAGAAGAAGCGYSVDPDMSRGRDAQGEIPSVFVFPFDNATFRRGLEVRLSRFLTDEMRARSPDATAARDQAEWLLEGTIERAGERVLSEDRNDQIRESSFEITVSVTLKERSTDRILGTDSFTTRESFSARAGRIATLEQAQEEALRDIAENIIYWLEARNPKESS